MKWKIVLALVCLVVVSVLLFAATVSAFMPPANFSNSATNTNGPSEFWSHWFEYDNRGGEGGMMNGWGPFAQNSNGTQSFDNGWSGHE